MNRIALIQRDESLVDGATQAIGVALRRSIVRDELRRAHARRSLGGDACCDEGRCNSGSDSDGGQGSSVRASSQSSEGRLLELGAGVPCEFLVIYECISPSSLYKHKWKKKRKVRSLLSPLALYKPQRCGAHSNTTPLPTRAGYASL